MNSIHGWVCPICNQANSPLVSTCCTATIKTRHTAALPKEVVDSFNTFYAAYPRKVAKPAAIKAWATICKTANPINDVLADIALRIESGEWAEDRSQFIPYPSTYINQRRWEDKPEAPIKKPLSPFEASKALEAVNETIATHVANYESMRFKESHTAADKQELHQLKAKRFALIQRLTKCV